VGGGGAPGKDSSIWDEETNRNETPKLDLNFPLELEFGKAKGKAGMGAGINAIALGCFTVIVG
jgi:hypothetical protein